MGAIADAALASGGKVIGVMPHALVAKERAHTSLSELKIVNSMHERKGLMADLADAFILLPGGFGSWEEFCEIVTWSQLGIHRKPCGLLNVEAYYDALLAQANRAVEEGFLQPAHRDMVVVESGVKELLHRLAAAPPVMEPKWIKSGER